MRGIFSPTTTLSRHYADLAPILTNIRQAGATPFRQIAARLDERTIPTARAEAQALRDSACHEPVSRWPYRTKSKLRGWPGTALRLRRCGDDRGYRPFGNARYGYTLQILHASDWEGGLLATRRAANFAAIVDKLEDATPNSITLSTGDGWIPSPFFIAGGDPQMAATYKRRLQPALRAERRHR